MVMVFFLNNNIILYLGKFIWEGLRMDVIIGKIIGEGIFE